MKTTAAIIIAFIFMWGFSTPALAVESYVEQIDQSLPDDVKKLLDEEGIDINISESIDSAGFFTLILSFFQKGISEPFAAAVKIFAVFLLCAIMNSYAAENKLSATVNSVTLLGATLVLAVPVYEIIAAAGELLKGASVFITAAVPVFAAVKGAGGKAVSVSGASAVLLTACTALSYVCSFVIVPFMNGYLALGICSSLGTASPFLSVMNGIKKTAMWIFSLCVTVFLFILSVKGIGGKAADTLAMRTAKFVLGTTVPMVGNALSESAAGVVEGMKALSGTVGIYIVIAVLVMVLPLLCRLICWRITLMLIKYLAGIFSIPENASPVGAVESVVSLLLGFCLLALALIIISMGVLISL